MDLTHPLAVVTPTLDGGVLGVLALADAEFTSGQVHRILAGPSPRGVMKVLERLTGQGIVLRHQAGRAYLYRLNREHLAAPHIIALANQRSTLLERLAQVTSAWFIKPVFGAVFGSATRADHTVESDIDLFLVHADDFDEQAWSNQTGLLAEQVFGWTGNDARVLNFAKSDVLSRAGREPVLDEIANEGLVFVGEPNWLRKVIRTTRKETPKAQKGRSR